MLYKGMKTWTQFIEAKAQLAPMDQQPVTAGQRPTARRSATLSLSPAQAAQGRQAHAAAQSGPAYGAPVSDEEMGAQYAKSMQIQQARAAAQRRR